MASNVHSLKKLGRRLCAAFAMTAIFYGPSHAQNAPENKVCAKNSDTAGFSQKLPKLYGDFQKMMQAPLTGKPVYDLVTKPGNGFQSCLVASVRNGGADAQYLLGEKILEAKEDTDIALILHENFHAVQDMNGAWNVAYNPVLTTKDTVIVSLLNEAAAFAYPFIFLKEAAESNPYSHIKSSNSFYNEGPVKNIFEKAYNKVLKKFNALDAQTRREKALQAGGRAVVLALLDGKNPSWTEHYISNAVHNAGTVSTAVTSDIEDYVRQRRDIYFKAGLVTSRINLTPGKFLEGSVDQTIDQVLKKLGVQATPRRDPPRKIPAAT